MPNEPNEFGRLDDVVRSAVATTPNPPRPVSLRKLLRVSYGSTSGKSLVGFGLVLFVPLFVIELLGAREDIGHLGFAIFAGIFGAFIFVAPALPARRAGRALREGVRATGEVIEVSYRPPGDQATIDAISNGFASGRRRVQHPKGAFEQPFECDSPWAGELRIGSTMALLLEPARPRVLLDLGLQSGARS